MTQRDYLLDEYAVPMPIRHIQEQVCRKHGLTMEQMLGNQRAFRVSRPRQEAMWLANKHTESSLTVIGRAFNRDHTTVMHAIKRHEQRLAMVA